MSKIQASCAIHGNGACICLGARYWMDRCAAVEKALREVCEHSARGSVVYQIAAGALACGCLETYPQLQAGRINHGPWCALMVQPPISESDSERVKIVRCRCGGFPRVTLMGRTICSVCGQDVPQAASAGPEALTTNEEWLNQRLANARIRNSELEQENARLKRELLRVQKSSDRCTCASAATDPYCRFHGGS